MSDIVPMFRVFDKREDKYADSEDFAIRADGRLMLYACHEGDYPTWETADGERYTVELCTGLKDRNGRLIYEGDVMHDSTPWPDVVVWNAKKAAFEETGGWDIAVAQAEVIIGTIHDPAFSHLPVEGE